MTYNVFGGTLNLAQSQRERRTTVFSRLFHKIGCHGNVPWAIAKWM